MTSPVRGSAAQLKELPGARKKAGLERGGAQAGEKYGAQAGMRTVLLVSSDAGLRQRLRTSLTGLRWTVREASGGAQAMAELEAQVPAAMLVDHWLPDLEAQGFTHLVRMSYPAMEVLELGGGAAGPGARGKDTSAAHVQRNPRRNELLHAMGEAHAGTATGGAPERGTSVRGARPEARQPEGFRTHADGRVTDGSLSQRRGLAKSMEAGTGAEGARAEAQNADWMLPELVGSSQEMRELTRLIRLVAPRSTTVLIEGETGTGKEVVARALHRLSARADKPFAVLNCAAIPESLLEAELFGHARGAFTGAAHSRMGRIETANGGTLLLDEIGEMPLGMQAKMLRFLESGELQRVGDNETTVVDVRLIAATHQPLERRSGEGTFRLDLYHRLAVFPVETPALRDRMGDLPALAEFFLRKLGQTSPRKRLRPEALALLEKHTWPGNVRELMHVLERGAILAGDKPEIDAEDIRYRRTPRV